VLGSVLLRWALARLDVEHAFFEGSDAPRGVEEGGFDGVEARRLALGVAVKSGEQVGLDSAGEFLGAVFGGLDYGPELAGACLDGGGDGFHGAVEGVAELLLCDRVAGVFGSHGRRRLLSSSLSDWPGES
jgi:hypothetical protein